MGGTDPPTTTDPVPGPQPAPTKTGYDYEDGVYRDNTSTITAYLPTYILTDDDNGFRWGAQPTAATYRQPVSFDDIRPITMRYLATFQVEYGKRYKHYVDYDYSKSTIVKYGPAVGPSWTFTSPYTGNVFTGVLPLTDFYIKTTGEHFYFFVEIFNDYQAYRCYADWDPDIDGPPGVSWIGVVPEFKAFFQANSVPVNLQGVLPVFVHIVDNTAQPTVDTYKYVYSHFGFVGKNRTENPRRYASYSRSIAERDVDTSSIPASITADGDILAYNADPTPAVGQPIRDRPVVNDITPSHPQVFFTSWNMVLPTTNGVRLGGANSTTYVTNRWTDVSNLQDMMRIVNNSDNSSGFNTLYNSSAKTYTVEINCRAVEQVQDPLSYQFGGSDAYKSYYSKWVEQTQFASGYNSSNYTSWPDWPATYVGIAWDGTGNGGQILADNFGCMRLVSNPYIGRVSVPISNAAPNTRFSEVLALAKSNIVKVTGRHQTPFTWFAKLGFIEYYYVI